MAHKGGSLQLQRFEHAPHTDKPHPPHLALVGPWQSDPPTIHNVLLEAAVDLELPSREALYGYVLDPDWKPALIRFLAVNR